MKIKTTKISCEGDTGKNAKVCTSENFPLYGIYLHDTVCIAICEANLFCLA